MNQSDSKIKVRFADLRRWLYLNNITVADLSRVCGISKPGIRVALMKDRMPVRHHEAITAAWPDLPVELLPAPLDIPTGPRPPGDHQVTA
jgi:hypothetical protein